MKYTINIGLKDNNYSNTIEHINNARQGGYFKDYNTKEAQSDYNGVKVPKMVLTIETEADTVSMVGLVKKWCLKMNQICISVLMESKQDDNTFGFLVYKDGFRGDKQAFNYNNFLK